MSILPSPDITRDDIQIAVAYWRKNVPPAFRGLLEGKGWSWDARTQEYTSSSGQKLPFPKLRPILLALLQNVGEEMRVLAANGQPAPDPGTALALLGDGSDNGKRFVPKWAVGIARKLKAAAVAVTAAVWGGVHKLTTPILARLAGDRKNPRLPGSRRVVIPTVKLPEPVAKPLPQLPPPEPPQPPEAATAEEPEEPAPPTLAFSYDRLEKFSEIETSQRAAAARAELYANFLHGIIEDQRRQSHLVVKDDTGNQVYLFERNVLAPADHCHTKTDPKGNITLGCVEVDAAGWQPIGTLPPPGTRTCTTHCKCHMIYSAHNPDMGTMMSRTFDIPNGEWKRGVPVNAPLKHESSSTHIPLDGEAAKHIHKVAHKIKEEHLTSGGRVIEPHVTVKYGLSTKNAGTVAGHIGMYPSPAFRFGDISCFESPKHDVLKYDIDSPDLHSLHHKLSGLKHMDTHGEYSPHVTIAYLKPGMGRKYAARFNRFDRTPRPVGAQYGTKLRFSDHQGDATDLPFGPPGGGVGLSRHFDMDQGVWLARKDEPGEKHWVTVGAEAGADGKKHGGTPVAISGEGKIDKGPAALVGKKPSEVGEGKEEGGELHKVEKIGPHNGFEDSHPSQKIQEELLDKWDENKLSSAQEEMLNGLTSWKANRAVLRNKSGNVVGLASYSKEDGAIKVHHLGSTEKGGGSKLIKEIAAEALKQGVPMRMESTYAARGFYEKLGIPKEDGSANVFVADNDTLKKLVGGKADKEPDPLIAKLQKTLGNAESTKEGLTTPLHHSLVTGKLEGVGFEKEDRGVLDGGQQVLTHPELPGQAVEVSDRKDGKTEVAVKEQEKVEAKSDTPKTKDLQKGNPPAINQDKEKGKSGKAQPPTATALGSDQKKDKGGTGTMLSREGDEGVFLSVDIPTEAVKLPMPGYQQAIEYDEYVDGVKKKKKIPVSYWRAIGIKCGRYEHPQKKFPKGHAREGQPYDFEVTPERLDRWVSKFKEMKAAGVEIPVCINHSFDAEDNRGFAESMKATPNGLEVVSKMIGEDGAMLAARNLRSVYFHPNYRDSSGKYWGDAIVHLGLTSRPVIEGLGEFHPVK